MPLIDVTFPKLPKKEAKEMLSVIEDIDANKITVKVNYSSLDIIQTCLRKAEYALDRKLFGAFDSPALTFGSAIHKAMEVWYCSKRESRKASSSQCDDSHAMMLAEKSPILHGSCARCGAIYAFLDVAKELNEHHAPRDPENGIKILNDYFDFYLDDALEIMSDSMGPLCERSFEIPIWKDLTYLNYQLEIVLHGTIDTVMRNKETGEILIFDHKTTSALGKDFFNRIKPNFQYTGYWLGATQVLNLIPSAFVVNGIQVAKTKTAFNRQRTIIHESEIQELRDAVLESTYRYLHAKHSQTWPMSTPNPCSMWGGCQYKKVCEASPTVRESIISAEFVTKGEIENGKTI